MRAGRFVASIDRAWQLLRRLSLDWDFNRHPNRRAGWVDTIRGGSYAEQWTNIVGNNHYDILLSDWSAILFEGDDFDSSDGVSYSFYQNPSDALDYQSFLSNVIKLDVEDRARTFEDDYDRYVETCDVREAVLPTRYDYSPRQYFTGVHPAAHLHLGVGSEVRLRVDRVMEPLSFVLFLIRQYYPQFWRQFLDGHDASAHVPQIRKNLALVDRQFVQARDECELYLA